MLQGVEARAEAARWSDLAPAQEELLLLLLLLLLQLLHTSPATLQVSRSARAVPTTCHSATRSSVNQICARTVSASRARV
jgi:hypothetical protein